MIRYARTPSPAFRALLAPAGLLSPLLKPRTVAELPLDIHVREDDHLHIYCGLTRLIDASFSRGHCRIQADPAYATQRCGSGLFRLWSPGESGLAEAAERFFAGVTVRPSYTLKEGAVQAMWTRIRHPWTPFDREAVLGYPDNESQARGRQFARVREAGEELERLRGTHRWGSMPAKQTGAELDQIAVDLSGRLVLLELKHAAGAAASVYYSPFQLLQYVHEWVVAFDSVRDHICALIEARKAIGLSPTDMPDLRRGIRAAIGFGSDIRSKAVRERFEAVRGIANRYLPDGVAPIEVWAMNGSLPVQIG